MNASPILDSAEHVFDLVTLPIEGAIMVDTDFAVGF